MARTKREERRSKKKNNAYASNIFFLDFLEKIKMDKNLCI
jgi:hypothetical protein